MKVTEDMLIEFGIEKIEGFSDRFPSGFWDIGKLWGDENKRIEFWQENLKDEYTRNLISRIMNKGFLPSRITANLSEYNLDNMNFRGAYFIQSDFYMANFSNSILTYARFQSCDLVQANLQAHLYTSTFCDCDLRGASFRSQILEGALFINCRLILCNFEKADLRKINFLQSDLREVFFLKTNLAGACFERSDLRKSDFREANLLRANIEDCNLRKSKLSEANLEDANLKNVNLKGADLRGANLTNAKFENIGFDYRTKWPENFDPSHLEN